MAKKKSSKKKKTDPRTRSRIIEQFGKNTSEIIKKASTILEEEIEAGITVARAMEKSIREEKKFQSDELSDMIKRLRKDTHHIVDVMSIQVDQLRSKEFDELVTRAKKDAHDVVDIVLDFLKVIPQIVNNANEKKNK